MSLYQKNLGKTGEDLASDFLKSHSFSILEKNFHSKFGEIDIIASKNHCLYFVEVKTRSSLDHGQPYEAVNKRKISHIKRVAQYYLLQKKIEDYKLKVAVFSIVIKNGITDMKFWEDIES
ncbi:MAG: YraN family protein [Patescibacteria group bacterium]|jgi:putative endonuclease